MKATTEPRQKLAVTPRVQETTANRPLRQIKKLLVAVDFSEPSMKAVKYAERFSEQFGAALTLVHVVEPLWYPHDWDYLPTIEQRGTMTAIEKEARARLFDLADKGLNPVVPATSVVKVGTPWNAIVSLAKELDIDLIIIGTHGRTGLKHVLLGSTAERVVRHAPCPVLVVRDRKHDFVS